MKKILFIACSLSVLFQTAFSQDRETSGNRILFRGLVMDASNFSPIANSQIMINNSFSSVSGADGTFSFYVNSKDSVLFLSLGYKPAFLYVSDTLKGMEFTTGIFMNSDTLSIGEVVIVPRIMNLKSDIINNRNMKSVEMENARYNMAISAYQGKIGQHELGDASANYEYIRQKQSIDAYEKGGIPSDKMVSLNALVLLPAAYFLIKGLPEKPGAFKPHLSDYEVYEIHQKYLETLKHRR